MKCINNLLIVFVLFFTSCENNNNEDLISETSLFSGKWELLSLKGGFAPTETYTNNEIIWNFISNDSLIVTIDKAISNNSRLPIKEDTSLFYSYDSTYLFIGNIECEYVIQEPSLKLYNNFSSDGIMLEFKRK